MDAPVLQDDFDGGDGSAFLSFLYQASCCGLMLLRPGMRFEELDPHLFIEL